MRTFTTGEIASLCNVSVRTVQYYDQEGIISPSDLSEGGRRIYTETDLSKFQLTCLYKSLGFSCFTKRGKTWKISKMSILS